MVDDGEKPKKAHKKTQGGAKAKKKQKKREKREGGKIEKHNPRANTFSGGVRSVQKRVQYTLDKQTKKERATRIDKTPDIAPPFVVVVQGPPGVGKTTLIRSLVKQYTKQRIGEPKGPVTLVSGRNRRLTIIECSQDIPTMLDLAKIADLCLLLVDAAYGFELETFEFLNILQVHGFPRVMGVLTHLDSFQENKQLRKVKRTMKRRFWEEIYNGAKLFYLSGLQFGRYHKIEVQNLARFIAVQKNVILSWRQAHPYLLALRWEDQTPPDKPKDDPRTLHIYGYVNGARLRAGTPVHLVGAGDFTVDSVKVVIDPCPPPEAIEMQRKKDLGHDVDHRKAKKQNALRSLQDRHRSIYAPGSDVGNVTIDAEVMYINLPEHQVGFTKNDGEDGEEETRQSLPEAVKLIRELQEDGGSLNRPVAEMSLLKGSSVKVSPQVVEEKRQRRPAPAAGSADPTFSDDEGAESEGGESSSGSDIAPNGEVDIGGEIDADQHKKSFMEYAKKRFERDVPLEEIVYGSAGGSGQASGAKNAGTSKDGATNPKTIPLFDDDDGAEDDDEGGEHASSAMLGSAENAHGVDSFKMETLPRELEEWDEARKEQLKSQKFITGGWDSANEDEAEDATLDAKDGDDEDGENRGDDEAGAKKIEKIEDGAGNESSVKKADHSEEFEDGAAIASYVRVVLKGVPAASVAALKWEKPLVMGGLLPGESGLGFVQMRVKKHRWHQKLLKSEDALLLSAGWRRFQTLPMYAMEDRGNVRIRFLKYTPEHMHCLATAYSPYLPPNTGVLAFRNWDKLNTFRVSMTGNSLESASDFAVMKKLKLIGEPYKVFKNTAFIKDMFNSSLEVSKFQHAKIQTVSGIRGEVKKPEGDKGNFRASFEDRILMSDLVVCKSWVRMEPRRFYNPMIDLEGWRRMKTIGELRHEKGMLVPKKKDSQYGAEVVRAERRFNPVKIPKNLEASLPFKTKPKLQDKKTRNKLQKKTAIVSSEQEKAVNSMINRLATIRKEKMRIRKESSTKKKVLKEKREKFIQDKRDAREQENRKKRYRKQGEEEQMKRKKLRLE